MKSKIFITALFFFPSVSFSYLSEQTHHLSKTMKATHYKQVAINEVVDEDGVVRKVSWKGLHPPDLEKLLGPCYIHYKDFLKQNNRLRMRGAVTIEKNGCHINIGGHMRNVSGEAFLDK
jgi:hypothetical protein